MNHSGYFVALLLVGIILTSVPGCKPKPESTTGGPTPEAEAAQKLPEGTNVLAALEQKDYEGAVAGLAKLKPLVGNGELAGEYMTLKLYVKNKLIELAPTDPKAAEALNGLRLLTQGR